MISLVKVHEIITQANKRRHTCKNHASNDGSGLKYLMEEAPDDSPEMEEYMIIDSLVMQSILALSEDEVFDLLALWDVGSTSVVLPREPREDESEDSYEEFLEYIGELTAYTGEQLFNLSREQFVELNNSKSQNADYLRSRKSLGSTLQKGLKLLNVPRLYA